MYKTIFDYESSEDEEEAKHPLKRTYEQFQNESMQTGFDKYLLSQKRFVEDIEKHCKNKRLKKNIYKMDCVKLI